MSARIKKYSEARIPTDSGIFVMSTFAEDEKDKMPHIVLSSPDTIFEDVVNVRIHSECITGDLFGSNRCECGDQLKASMNYVQEHTGLIIYLRQEGRGIGIINKLHAYVKQDDGYDTAEANKVLGLEYDARTYEDAIEILMQLGITRINLLTNNPEKIKAIEDSSVELCERIPLIIPTVPDNQQYMDTKRDFFKHLID